MPYHKIPNFELGNFGSRHQLHVFFPDLWSSDRAKGRTPHQTSETERSLWYEHGFRPAIINLLGANIASEWPATVETERIRAQRRGGALAWGTKMIAKDAVEGLADRIRYELDSSNLAPHDIAWARGFFILHTIRGAKHSSFHQATPAQAQFYLDEFIWTDGKLSHEVPEVGNWFIDVAIEISSSMPDPHCLQWMTSTHNVVLQQALRISDENATRLSDITSSQYSRDLSSHLTALSGFRVTPGKRGEGDYQAKYVQAYTTDKSVVYNPDSGHHAKFLTMKDAMGDTQPPKTVDGIYTIYEAALESNSSNARLEMRVPFEFATTALLEFDPDLLQSCLCSYTRQEWW